MDTISPYQVSGYCGTGDAIGRSEVFGKEGGVSVEVKNITTGETLCQKSGENHPCRSCQDRVCETTRNIIKNRILSV